MERANKIEAVYERWIQYGLPKDMKGKSFLDVGCWAGGFCSVALGRGADWAVGVDLVESKDWGLVRQTWSFELINLIVMDIMSPNFLALPQADVVLCAGVLYHVSDPVGLLRRLRMKTGSLLVLETAITPKLSHIDGGLPILQYCPNDSFDNNHSNWFLPNTPFLDAICEEVGFEVVLKQMKGGRAWYHLKPFKKLTDKLLPRKPQYMKS